MRPPRVLTWHVHGNYLWYLSHANAEFYLPVRRDDRMGYGGRGRSFPFGDNVVDVPYEEISRQSFDCILFQSRAHYEEDQHDMLTPAQRRLPRVYIEHDPPQEHPTDQRHWVDDPNVLLVHVTAFNRLMWDNGETPTRVIEHGVVVPADVRYDGSLRRGVTIINHLRQRGRRLGADVFEQARNSLPLDLLGMGAEEMGGLGEVPPTSLARVASRYRFFFNPIRYTSFGLAVCEAMMIGLPIVALATTEYVTGIRHGVSGFLATEPTQLYEPMRRLLASPKEARQMGAAARREAMERFDIRRFAREWETTLADITGLGQPRAEPQGSPGLGALV